jgi:hypothetical protein
MKKVLLSAFVIALFAIGFTASDDEKRDSVAHEEVPANMETVNVEQMLLDLNQNEMRAQKKYADKWFEIVGRLGGMDSEGEYFSLVGEAFSMVDVHCKIPKDKREELTDILANMNKGETIAVKGKVTDMGEIMGYDVSIVEVYRKSGSGTAKVVEQVAESIVESVGASIADSAPVDDYEEETVTSNNSGYESVLSERKLTDSDLSSKTKKELELMRNSIYARYGYRFKRDDLFNHFSQFSWYSPTTSDMSAVFSSMSAIEKFNVDFIKKHE